ncbi:MAG TPA: MBOAT family protein [Cytophagales bacterium]|nr:MBOAT family protein [Cytophagales bacterium]
MLFNSQEFLWLFFGTFLLYYLPFFSSYQVKILILSSFFFYAYGQPVLLALLLFSITMNAYISYVIANHEGVKRKFLSTMGVVANLVVIVFFKYSGMLTHTFGFEDSGIGHFLMMLPLPLGISFFTFEGITLVVDVYKGHYGDSKNFSQKGFKDHLSKTMLFVSFFPHLIAGPILKANEFYPQIVSKKWSGIHWEKAFRQLVVGYFLKVVVADNLKDYTYWIDYPNFMLLSTTSLLVMLFGYSMQIFSDFAGYSLIALGLATLFGYELKGNFNFPYISTSFGEFWRRWHISLSTFLKEYLYFPLGGNRKGKLRTYFNLFVTMFLGGLWHGAAWSYAVWGTAHGLFLALERLKNDYLPTSKIPFVQFMGGILVFTGVTFAWLLFKLPDFSHAVLYLQNLSANIRFETTYDQLKSIGSITVYSFPVVAYHVRYLLCEKEFYQKVKKIEWVLFGLMLLLIFVNAGTKADFIYFQF